MNYSTLLTTSDSQIIKSSAVKMACCLAVFAHDMKHDASIKMACDMYGIENDKGHALYERAKGYYKDYLKPISEIRHHLTSVLESIKAVSFDQTHSKLAKEILELPIYGELETPRNKTQWMQFLKAFVPQQEQSKEPAPKTAKSKSKDTGKEATQATADINTAIQQLFDKAAGSHAKFVNGYINELKDLGLPKTHAAKVSTVMLKMLADYDKTIVKAMQK